MVARPPSAFYRFQKFVRRHQLATAAVLGVAVCLVLGIAATVWEGARAARLSARAIAKDREAHHLLYVADINLVQQAWEQNNLGLAHELLKETAGFPERGFEWFYWQRQMHRELKTLRGHRGIVQAVAFSPDGRWIATGSQDATARVWDLESGQRRVTCTGHMDDVTSVAFSRDGQKLATSSMDHTARVWDLTSSQALFTLRGHTGAVQSVAFAPDGQRLVTGIQLSGPP
jgi:hypothetical protein